MTRTYPLVQYLERNSMIDAEMAQKLREHEGDSYKLLTQSLVSSGILSDSEIARLESLFSGFPLHKSPDSLLVDAVQQSLIPQEFAKRERLVCVGNQAGALCVVTDQPYLSQETITQLGQPIHSIERVGEAHITALLDEYERTVEQSLRTSIVNTSKKVRTIDQYGSRSMTFLFPDNYKQEIAEDLSPLKLLRRIVALAEVKRAEKIILRPTSNKLVVSFLMHKETHSILELDKKIEQSLYLKLRYLADMGLQEVEQIEDGLVEGLDAARREVVYAVKFIPQALGTTMMLQHAGTHKDNLLLEAAEFGLEDRRFLQELLAKPSGMVVVSGMSGVGKTFAAYHVLEAAAVRNQVVTLEQEIEYVVDNIDQMRYSKRAEKDLQMVRDSYEVFGLLPLKSSLMQAAYNLSTHKLVLSEVQGGVLACIKQMLSLGIHQYDIAKTLRCNVVSHRFKALAHKGAVRASLDAGSVATLETYLSIRQFNDLLETEGMKSKDYTSWSQVEWYEQTENRKAWWHWPSRQQQSQEQDEYRYVRAVAHVGSVIEDSYARGERWILLEQHIKEEQKKVLLSRALLLALQGEISISAVIAMLRS